MQDIAPEIIIEQLKARFERAREDSFTFLLAGRTGVGKSSTINSLFNREVAPIGEFEPKTMEVNAYNHEVGGIRCQILDTPGLCDDVEEKGNDQEYLGRIRAKIKDLDSLWFVTRLDDTRVSSDEKRAIRLIGQALGEDVWKNSVIIFTFAGKVPPDQYPRFLQERSRLIREEIKKTAGSDVAAQIPSVAVENGNTITPDGQTWLNRLYVEVFRRISDRGAVAFFLATVDMLAPARSETVKSARNRKAQKNYEQWGNDWDDDNLVEYPRVISRNDVYVNVEVPAPHIHLTKQDQSVVQERMVDIVRDSYRKGVSRGRELAGTPGAIVGGVIGGIVGVAKAAKKLWPF